MEKGFLFSTSETETHKTVADQTLFERSSKCILTAFVKIGRENKHFSEEETRKINEFLGLGDPWVQVERRLLICWDTLEAQSQEMIDFISHPVVTVIAEATWAGVSSKHLADPTYPVSESFRWIESNESPHISKPSWGVRGENSRSLGRFFRIFLIFVVCNEEVNRRIVPYPHWGNRFDLMKEMSTTSSKTIRDETNDASERQQIQNTAPKTPLSSER
jgi:hypothetical protein